MHDPKQWSRGEWFSHSLAFGLEILLVVIFVRAGMALGGEGAGRWIGGALGGLAVVLVW